MTKKTIVSVTSRIYDSNVQYGSDRAYRNELASILGEIISIAGPIHHGADYPIFACGDTWAFKLGTPRDYQEHYIEFMREEDAVFYMLKYGGVVIDDITSVELGYAKV